MREIVHIQAGQCGNQIGAKVNIKFLILAGRVVCVRYNMADDRSGTRPTVYRVVGSFVCTLSD